jgi:hypothetical protein
LPIWISGDVGDELMRSEGIWPRFPIVKVGTDFASASF